MKNEFDKASMRLDVKENILYFLDPAILKTLLQDRITHKNIIWATNDYSSLGEQYAADQQIVMSCITGLFGNTIRPRSDKSKAEQTARIRDKAEVFTPSWVCNCQNNLVDHAWFGRSDVFNTEIEKGWITNYENIDKNKIRKNIELVGKWKIFTSKGNGAAGTIEFDKPNAIIGKAYVAAPDTACSDSLIPIGAFDTQTEAENLAKYMSTRFLRFMVGAMKTSRNIYQVVYRFVPLQDFMGSAGSAL